MPTVVQGEPVEITATIDDRRYRNGAGAPPVIHTISGADVFVDAMPWQAGAAGLPMAALDGAFDQSSEEAKLVLETGAMAPGRHLIVIQGHDAAGEHGPPSSVFLEIKVNSDIIFDSDFEQIDPVVAGR